MTKQFDLDLVLDEWMRDGPDSGPDRVIDRVADQIDRVPQQHAWRLQGRSPFMTRTIQVAVALAAAVAIVFGGYSLLPRSGPGFGGVNQATSPMPSVGVTTGPSVAVSPAPRQPCPEWDGGPCLGPLDAGTHSSSGFTVPITYTVPDGWTNVYDHNWDFMLLPPGGFLAGVDPGTSNYVGIDWDVRAPRQDCSNTPDPGVGHSAKDLATWMAALPGLESDGPHPMLVGTLEGYSVDVSIDPTWTGKCPLLYGGPSVEQMVSAKIPGFWRYVIAGLAFRYIFLDVPAHAGQCDGGATCPVAIEVGYTPRAQTFDEYLQQVSPVIASLAFTPTPEGPAATLPPSGHYHAVVTPAQFEAVGNSGAADNAGTLDLTIAGDALALHWSGAHAPYDCTASQSVQGDRVLVTWKTGCSGDFAYAWEETGDGMVWSTPEFPGLNTVVFGHAWASGPSASSSPSP